MKKVLISEGIENIDPKYINEAAIYAANRRNIWIRWSVVAACLMLIGMFFVPMARELPFFSNDLPEPSIGTGGEENNVSPEPVGTGGEGIFEYERAYHWKIYGISGELYDYISKKHDLQAWLAKEDEKNKADKYTISSPDYTPVLIRIINEFKVPKTVFEQFNSERISIYKKNGWDARIADVCFTQEEIDALYSNDDARITKAFSSEYAIISGDKAYAPRFYLNATDEELSKYGITHEMIAEKKDLLLSSPILNELFSDLILQKTSVE